MHQRTFSLEVGGKTLTAEFNDFAEQANGSVMMRYGNTVVLATAVMSTSARQNGGHDGKGHGEDGGFLPLTVEYEERFYASGRILGSRFMRREGRPSDEAILSGRIVDRTIRPLFNQNIRNEIQVVLTVMSIDEDDPDVVSVIAASLALGVSDIPWDGPVSAVRVTKNEVFHVNPNYATREEAGVSLELVACGKEGLVNMIEVGSKEVSEAAVIAALKKAGEEIEKIQKWQREIVRDIGKAKRHVAVLDDVMSEEAKGEMRELFAREISPKLEAYLFNKAGTAAEESKRKMGVARELWMAVFTKHFEKSGTEMRAVAANYFNEVVGDVLHDAAIRGGRRPDGRGPDEIRPLYAKAGGLSPILHGSGIFYRGSTHILSALTLGGPADAQTLDDIEHSSAKKRFMHHYNFPPFSTGETGRIGGVNRRMIGHGALAEKALLPVIPTETEFPYTIRIVSEAFSSNGSTSMASICGSTLALMDAGVPIKAPVAGIASGLMMRRIGERSAQGDMKGNVRKNGSSLNEIEQNKLNKTLGVLGAIGRLVGTGNTTNQLNSRNNYEYKILTDIQGPEDHHGDMDFKVAGTAAGITAIQMDVKVAGIPLFILEEAFEKARIARLTILNVITKEIPAPRKDISLHAPKILSLTIHKEQIGLVIGTGGKTINEIKAKTGVDEITIEDSGLVYITGKNGSPENAKAVILSLIAGK